MLVELCCILFLQVIGGVEFGTGGGALRFAPLVVRNGEESFEASLSFYCVVRCFQVFQLLTKKPV